MKNLRQIGPNQYKLIDSEGKTTHLITKKAEGKFERMAFGSRVKRTNHTSLADAVNGTSEVKRQVAEGCYLVA